jgi:hypothetical protein
MAQSGEADTKRRQLFPGTRYKVPRPIVASSIAGTERSTNFGLQQLIPSAINRDVAQNWSNRPNSTATISIARHEPRLLLSLLGRRGWRQTVKSTRTPRAGLKPTKKIKKSIVNGRSLFEQYREIQMLRQLVRNFERQLSAQDRSATGQP